MNDNSLSYILSNKRRDINLSLGDVGAYLKVKAKDIEALENENWDKITSHLYKPGLIRSYASMLKISPEIVEEKLKTIVFESNIKSKKYKLVNIGEDIDLTPSRQMLLNYILISVLLFLTLLSIYNSLEKSAAIKNDEIIKEIEKTGDYYDNFSKPVDEF